MQNDLVDKIMWESLNHYFTELSNFSCFSTHLKDAKTGKYIVSNPFQAKNFGFDSPNSVIGLTALDLTERLVEAQTSLQYFRDYKDKFARQIEEVHGFDNQVLINRLPVAGGCSLLSLETGFVHIIKTIKAPLFDSHQRVAAILSLDYDLTPHHDLPSLLDLYLQYFPPRCAIQKILNYLSINTCFSELPTQREFKTLLFMCRNQSSKHIARHLNISHRTADEYKHRLRCKAKTSLSNLLEKLRTRTQKIDIISNVSPSLLDAKSHD